MPFLDYDLPSELIAQKPAAVRDQSRLMVLRRADQSIAHHIFADLPNLLASGDLLVLNDTKVIPARLLGRRKRTGGKWEGLFLREVNGTWEMLCQTRGTLVPGELILIEPGASATGVLSLTYLGRTPGGHFLFQPPAENTHELLNRFGHVPLPPYIRKGLDRPGDSERYQTVFAHKPGAVAAPTAGLHFTEGVFRRLAERGIRALVCDIARRSRHVSATAGRRSGEACDACRMVRAFRRSSGCARRMQGAPRSRRRGRHDGRTHAGDRAVADRFAVRRISSSGRPTISLSWMRW